MGQGRFVSVTVCASDVSASAVTGAAIHQPSALQRRDREGLFGSDLRSRFSLAVAKDPLG